MRKPDFQKSADELESDSCFTLLCSCNDRIAAVEAKLAELRYEAATMTWGTVEERSNDCAQRERYGELLGLAFMQGVLEAQCQMKTSVAAIARAREASQEVA